MSLTEFGHLGACPHIARWASQDTSGHKQHRHKTKPALLTMATKPCPIQALRPTYPLPRAHGALASLAYSLSLRHAKFSLTTGPLHLPFLLLGMLFLQIFTGLAPPCPSALSLPRCLPQEGLPHHLPLSSRALPLPLSHPRPSSLHFITI